ncbi:uncharacterized protein BCR38DRAFT_482395 [Pseudomassariella vexata]|uniref:FHA domain-containing protein n=1 Tax=Pseudomassariella vexata TaxID=1141098 RepID=A0A1Y2EBJ0_9PEZI|nr:uncharacterized protein BCR38DRAFT_482395 [Pseudomassariella vexata]ORY68921.1 hypothetical protein BCR38DRAFT_482395 [Pseudomassariella vexata]
MDFSSDSTRDEGDLIVTLKAYNPGPLFVEPERQIRLTPKNTSIFIGRASKVPSKGFVAGRANAWFESPVMSRQHAELIANFDNKSISIKDIGSLHGTFHTSNGTEKRLPEKEQVKLANGDKIRFGIDIYRSQQTFPPSTVEVHMNWSQPISETKAILSSTNKFTVPDYDESDNDIIMENRTHGVTESIDLTGDSPSFKSRYTPSNTIVVQRNETLSSDFIDLTYEPDHEAERELDLPSHAETEVDLAVSEAGASEPEKEDHNSEQESELDVEPHNDLRWRPGGIVSDSDSDCDSDGMSYCSDAEGEREDLHNAERRSLSPIIAMHDATMEMGGWDDSDDGDSVSDSYDSDESESRHLPFSEDEEHSNMEDMAVENSDSDDHSDLEDDNSSISQMDADSTSDYFEEDEALIFRDENYFDENDNMDSESDDQVETSLFDQSHKDSSPSSSPVAQQAKNVLNFGHPHTGLFVPPPPSSTDAPAASQFLSPWASTPPPYLDNANLSKFADAMKAISKPSGFAQGQPGIVSLASFNSAGQRERQPSPSDAAMAKSHPACDQLYKSTAQVLGEKTGKFEFFAARDINKSRAAVMSEKPSAPIKPPTPTVARPPSPVPLISAIRETLGSATANNAGETSNKQTRPPISPTAKPVASAWTEPTPAKASSLPHSKIVPDTLHFGMPDRAALSLSPPVQSAWIATGNSFINSPPNSVSEKRTRLQSPELDMTSAFTFQQSKLAAKTKVENIRRLPIQDLLAKEASPVSRESETPIDGTSAKRCASLQSSFSANATRTDAYAEDNVAKIFTLANDTTSHAATPAEDATAKSLASGSRSARQPVSVQYSTIIEQSPAARPPKRCFNTFVEDLSTVKSVPRDRAKVETVKGLATHSAAPESAAGSLMEADVETRPAKRRRFTKMATYGRRVAEVAAFVGLGAAAVFSTLVATAPQFA